jgi:hypothetical protein
MGGMLHGRHVSRDGRHVTKLRPEKRTRTRHMQLFFTHATKCSFFLAQTAHTPALGHVADGHERCLTNTPVCVVKEGYQRLPKKQRFSKMSSAVAL